MEWKIGHKNERERERATGKLNLNAQAGRGRAPRHRIELTHAWAVICSMCEDSSKNKREMPYIDLWRTTVLIINSYYMVTSLLFLLDEEVRRCASLGPQDRGKIRTERGSSVAPKEIAEMGFI